MNRFPTLTLIIGLALIHASAIAAPAQLTVRYSDLDLNRTEGVKILYHRLQRAAEVVCSDFQRRDPATAAVYQTCIHDGMQAAVAKIDQPLLTAYYRAQSQPGAGGTPIRVVQK